MICATAPLFVAPTNPALAHASERGHILLLPTGHYIFAGAFAVAASFLVLTFMPRDMPEKISGLGVPLLRVGDAARVATSLASFAFFVLLLSAGILGSRDPLSNPLPLTVWTLLWVGVTLTQGILGNLWHWIDPWYGPWRIARAWLGPASAPMRLAPALGYWPAVILLCGFAWFELVYPAPDDPERLALAAGLYWLLAFAGMLAFGHDEFTGRGEFLSVFFGMLARLAILQRDRADGRRIELRVPGTGLWTTEPLPFSGMVFLLAALGSVSFDGLSRTFFWLDLIGVNPLEFPGRSAVMAENSLGLFLTMFSLICLFLFAVAAGGRMTGRTRPLLRAAGQLVWSIVPIALAYHFSHYLVVFSVNGQYALVALSDPFFSGWDLFGTADLHVRAGISLGARSAWVIWNLQASAIVAGHVLAVLAAHGLASRLHPSGAGVSASQVPLTLLMIGYTVFGLWLLSTPTAG